MAERDSKRRSDNHNSRHCPRNRSRPTCQDNPLLREPLQPQHIKNRMLGHWGASPALSFVYTHLNRIIKKYDQEMIFMAGPGHGAPGVLAPVYLEGAYSEIYPDKSLDEEGL